MTSAFPVGLSRFEEESKLMYTMIGTPQFSAVEILRDGQYGPQVDLWSCGVMCYNMLTGMLPFSADEVLETFSTGEIQVPYPDEYWASVSDEAMRFTRQLLCKDPHVRLSAQGAICSSWLSQDPGHVWKDLLPNKWTDSAGQKEKTQRFDARSVTAGTREEELMAAAISQATRKRWRAATTSIVALIRLGGLESKTEDIQEKSLSRSSFASIGSCAESDWDYSEADFDALSHINSLDSSASEFQGRKRPELGADPTESLEEAALKWQKIVVTSTGDGKSSTRQDRGNAAPRMFARTSMTEAGMPSTRQDRGCTSPPSNFARVSMTEVTNGRNFQRNRDSIAALEADKDASTKSTEPSSTSPSAVSEHAQKTPLSPGRSIFSMVANMSSPKGIFRKKKNVR